MFSINDPSMYNTIITGKLKLATAMPTKRSLYMDQDYQYL